MPRFDTSVFEYLHAYCMFVGYSRSGHTLVGSLLDAHENAVIAHELDALRFVDAGVERDELFAALLQQSAAFTRTGRAWSGSQYLVPDQWHSRASTLRVIGDKKGGRSTFRLLEKPELLDRLRAVVQLPLRIVHAVRNPWDVIATMYCRRRDDRRPVSDFVDEFFAACRTNDVLRYELDGTEVLDVCHEELVREPKAVLHSLCEFLNLPSNTDYFDDCASIVSDSPHASRFEMEWPDGLVDSIGESATEYEFLRDYDFAA